MRFGEVVCGSNGHELVTRETKEKTVANNRSSASKQFARFSFQVARCKILNLQTRVRFPVALPAILS